MRRRGPRIGGRLRAAGQGALRLTTLLTRGPRRPASPADPRPLPGTAPLRRSCRPHPEPGPGAEGVRALDPPGEDQEVAILFSGNCVCA